VNICESCKKFVGCQWAGKAVSVCCRHQPITRVDLADKDAEIAAMDAEIERARSPAKLNHALDIKQLPCEYGRVSEYAIFVSGASAGFAQAVELFKSADGCKGANCGSTAGKHSPECIIEAAEAQGWARDPIVKAAQDFIQLRDNTPPREGG
jgi:hypothetical protein